MKQRVGVYSTILKAGNIFVILLMVFSSGFITPGMLKAPEETLIDPAIQQEEEPTSEPPTATPEETPTKVPTAEPTQEPASTEEPTPTEEPTSTETPTVEPTQTEITIQNIPPTMTFVKPPSDVTVSQGDDVVIEWTDKDPDDNALISLALDNDNDLTNGFYKWIVQDIEEDPDGESDKYILNTEDISAGSYYLIGLIADPENNPFISVAVGQLIISDLSIQIIGGQPADPGEWPWQVFVIIPRNDILGNVEYWACGGSLIHPNWIITAAHCVEDFKIGYSEPILSEMRVITGQYTYPTFATPYSTVKRIVVHDNYSILGPFFGGDDIALLELEDSVGLDTVTQIIPMVTSDIGNLTGHIGWATGWGDTIVGQDSPSTVLQEVSLNILSNSECNGITEYIGLIKDSMICAGWTTSPGTGHGDSGGPLTVNINGWKLAGITSGGSQPIMNNPSVFTRVSSYTSWVNNLAYVSPDLSGINISSSSLVVNQTATITITSSNIGTATSTEGAINASVLYSDGSDDLGISFPEPDWADISYFYDPGQGAIHNPQCQNIGSAQDHLIEVVDKLWEPGESHELTFQVTPHTEGTLWVRIRTTMQNGGGCNYANDISYSYPNSTISVDQQGWQVIQIPITVSPTPGYSVTGYVKQGTSPLPNVLVSNGSQWAYTNSSGYFQLAGVPNGNYTITPSLAGYSFNPTSRNITVNGANTPVSDFYGTPISASGDTFYPVADTSISGQNQYIRYGTDPQLWLGYNTISGQPFPDQYQNDLGMLRFDLSSLAGKVVYDAELQVYFNQDDGQDIYVNACKLLDPWDESIRYSEWVSPNADYSCGSASEYVSGSGWTTWDLASIETYAAGWVANPSTNYGFLLRPSTSLSYIQDAKHGWVSKEGNSSYWPRLIVKTLNLDDPADLMFAGLAPDDGSESPFPVGQQIRWRVVTSNVGVGDADRYDVGYYLGSNPNDFSNRIDEDRIGPTLSGDHDDDNDFVYAFTQPGTYYLNVWVDDNNGAGGTGEVWESNDNNNKGSYGPFIVYQPKYPPVLDGIPDQLFDEDTINENVIDLWSYTSDLDTLINDMTFQISSVSAIGGGVVISDNRYIDINPMQNWNGSVTVELVVFDESGNWDTDTFVVTINPVNDPPRITPVVPNQLTSLNQDISIDLSSYEKDVDDSDIGLDWTAIGLDHCTVSGANSDSDILVFTPDTDFLGTDEITLQLTDAGGLQATQFITLQWVAEIKSPEIDVQGNGISITDGSTTTSTNDGTNFGSVSVKDETITHTFTILNSGEGDLILGGNPIVGVTGPNASEFIILPLPSSPVAPLGSTTFSIKFNPVASGLRTATISISNNDSDENPYTFLVSGIATEPEIDIKGNSLSINNGDISPRLDDHTDFGSVNIGGIAVERTFTIYSMGNMDLSLTGDPKVRLSGANAGNFSVITQPDSPVASLGSTSFVIAFNPSEVGLHTATVSIDNSDADENPYTFTIQGTGEPRVYSISGYVTNEFGDPLENIVVSLDGPGYGDGTCTASDGSYIFQIEDIVTEWRVRAAPEGENWCGGPEVYSHQYWDSVLAWNDATTIQLTEEQPTRESINFQLAGGGRISGIVQDSIGNPVADVCINLYTDTQNWQQVAGWGRTGEDGVFSFAGVPVGSYFVRTDVQCGGVNSTLSNEWFAVQGSTQDGNLADAVDIQIGQNSIGIDFQLDIGGSISGHVYERDSVTPVTDARVCALLDDENNDIGCTKTDDEGFYLITGLPQRSDYFVEASAYGFLRAYHLYETNWYSALDVPVLSGQETNNIDIELIKAEANTYIQGHVSYADDSSASHVWMEAFHEDGWFVGISADENGDYSIPVIAGDWQVYPYEPPMYADVQFINIASGQTITGIDFQLEEGGIISGTVVDSSENPVEGVCINIYSEPKDWMQVNGWGVTGPDGSYSFDGVPAGNYYVRTDAQCSGGNAHLINEWYSSSGSTYESSQAEIVLIQSGVDTPNIDFQLDMGGSITGHVYETGGITPVENVDVCVSLDDVNNSISCRNTDSNGYYEITGLPERPAYKVQTHKVGYLTAFYPDVAGWDEATEVLVTAGHATSDIDIQMVKADSYIEGHVSYSDGSPASYVWMEAFHDDGWFVGVSADENGDYSIPVIAGNWQIFPYEPPKLVNQQYLSIETGQTITGVDFQFIEADSFIQGHVEYQDGSPASNIWMEAFHINEDWFVGLSADENGDYSLPVVGGTWYVSPYAPPLNVLPQYIEIENGETITGIDFVMSEEPVTYPRMTINVNTDVVEYYDWPMGEIIEINIDDPDTGMGMDYTDSQVAGPAPWDPNQVGGLFFLDGQYDIQVGDLVKISSETMIKWHMVRNLEVTSADSTSDIISGTAQAGAIIEVEVNDYMRNEIADSEGNWSVDFSVVGDADDEQFTYDIQPGDFGGAMQADGDDDRTRYSFQASGSLAAPSILSISSTSISQIELSWIDNSNDESSFRIERSPSGMGSWQDIGSVGAGITSYQNSGLSCGMSYDYRVRAYRDNDEAYSNFSNTVTGSTSACPVPNVPTNLSAIGISPVQIDLTWTDNSSDETSFKIQRSPSGMGDWQDISSVGAGVTSYNNLGLSCGATYDYRVRAYREADAVYSIYSNTTSGTTQVCPLKPSIPALLSPKSGTFTNDNTPTFEWGSVAYGEQYEIQISSTYTFKALVDTHTGSGLSYTQATLPDGKYYWRVRAQNSLGVSGSWSGYRIVTIDTFAPPAPLLSSPADNGIVVGTPIFKWLAASGAKNYVFEYDGDAGFGSPEYTSAELTVLKHTPPAMELGDFYWHVRAVDAAGNVGPWSALRMVTISPPKPVAPVLLSPKSGENTNDNMPTFEWGNVTYGELYEIQISKSTLFKPLVDTHTGSELSYIPAGLPDGKYYWRVRAKNNLGVNGSWSAYRKIKIDTTPPGVPILTSPADMKVMTGTPTFKWLSASGAKYYIFEYDDDTGFGSPEYTSVELTVLTHKPPAMGVGDFYWHVKAIDVAGNIGSWSSPRVVTNMTSDTTKTLTVEKAGSGSGVVTSEPSGISCGSICQVNSVSGLTITLSAQADAGSTFAGWSGSGCSGMGTCVVTMDAAKSVTATFNSDPYVLTLTKAGTGNGTVSSSPTGINCGSTCSSSYDYNTLVTLTAAPSAGSTFTGWSGSGCSGTGSCVVTMDAAKSVTATFTLNTYVLTVSKSGTGSGSVTGSPTGINCGSTCSASYNYNTQVTLTATASAGSTFTGWSGSSCNGTGSCVVTMDAAKSVTATFDLGSVILFQDDFSTNLNQWTLWGDPQPAIDNDIGNPSPGYRNRGDGMFNSGALSNMVFTPTPGMEISVDLRINSTGLHWIGLGFSRIFDPGDNHEDTRLLVGMGVDTNNYYILDCSQNPVTKDVFHHFKFVVRNDYKVDAYMGSTETYICTSGFTLSEFVDKPLLLWGRDGYADNVLVVQN